MKILLVLAVTFSGWQTAEAALAPDSVEETLRTAPLLDVPGPAHPRGYPKSRMELILFESPVRKFQASKVTIEGLPYSLKKRDDGLIFDPPQTDNSKLKMEFNAKPASVLEPKKVSLDELDFRLAK